MYGEREKERRGYESWTKVGESEKVKDGERQREDRYAWIVEGAKGLSAPCLPGINHGISDAQPVSIARKKHLLGSKSRRYLIYYLLRCFDVLSFSLAAVFECASSVLEAILCASSTFRSAVKNDDALVNPVTRLIGH